MVGHAAVEPELAKRAVGEVQMNLIAQSPFGADAEAVADDQHSDQQLRIDGTLPHIAIERGCRVLHHEAADTLGIALQGMRL